MTQTDRQDDHQNDSVSAKPAIDGKEDNSASAFENVPSELNTQSYGLKFTLEDGESMLFTSLPIEIGRAVTNDIILSNETVSAHHAQIYYDDKVNDICIVDLDSVNGLFLDHQPTRRNVLYDGAKISLGSASLFFRDTGFIYPG